MCENPALAIVDELRLRGVDLEAIGTNAHALPIALAALAGSDANVAAAPHRVLEEWRTHYDGNLLSALPDACEFP